MKDQFNILVPFDFRPEAEAALDYAIILARKFDARIFFIYIMEEESALLRSVLTDKQREQMRRGAEEQLSDIIVAKSVDSEGFIEPLVKKGKVYNKIIEAVSEIKANLIIMGRTDSSDIIKNFTGTNTMHIVRESEIPVITLKKASITGKLDHVLLPLDLSKQTLLQVSKAIKVCRDLNTRVTLASVLTVDSAALEIKYSTRLREIANIFEHFGLICDYQVIKGENHHIFEIINNLAHKIQADLIMIMTHQELDFTEYFIGSTAQEIINKSEIPVLSLIPEAEGPEIVPDDMIKALIDPINIFKY